MSPGGQIIQKATTNTIYLALRRNFTRVNGDFSANEAKALRSNSANAILFSDFTKSLDGLSLNDIKHMNDMDRFGEIKSDFSAAGPFNEIRYVKVPAILTL